MAGCACIHPALVTFSICLWLPLKSPAGMVNCMADGNSHVARAAEHSNQAGFACLNFQDDSAFVQHLTSCWKHKTSAFHLQAVHSGADLQSAAAAVMGYDQVSMKGKAIKVPPVPGVATADLQGLLDTVLPQSGAETKATSEDKGSPTSIVQTDVQSLLAVRQELLPALAKGNHGCGERLR